jgi:hypothetical protein
MPYPSRGAWRFRNVTGAFDFHPLLDSISIEEVHPDGLSTLTCDVRDTGSLNFANEDKCWVKFEGDKIWAGHVKVRTRTFLDEKSQTRKLWRLEGQDYTSKLDDSVITTRGWRNRESAADRVDFILGHLLFPITTAGVDLPAVQVDRVMFENMTVREALQLTADELTLHFYVDFGDDAGGPPDLHMFQTETFDAPFDLDADSPDYADSFPFSEFSVDNDSQDYKNAVRVRGDRIRLWVVDQDEIDDRGRQETAVTAPELVTLAQVRNAGRRVLDQDGEPEVHGELLCHEPGLRAGMRFTLRLDAWSLDTSYIATGVTISAVDPEDVSGDAYLFSRVMFSDKRRVRRMPGGGRPESGGAKKKADGLDDPTGGTHEGHGGGQGGCGCPVDMSAIPLDDFERADVSLLLGTPEVGVLGSLPVPTDVNAWWSGGNEWYSALGANLGAGGIEDGAFFAESTNTVATNNEFSMRVFGSLYPGPDPATGPELPLEGEDWEVEIRYRITGAMGTLADANRRFFGFNWGSLFANMQVNLGDTTLGQGIEVTGVATDTATRFLTPLGSWGLIRWRTAGGIMSAKEWAEGDEEPDWEVSAGVDLEGDQDSSLEIYGRLGNPTGPFQRLEIDHILVTIPAGAGELVQRSIAHGSGGIIDVGEPFEDGTLTVLVDDTLVIPDSEDAGAGTADLGYDLDHDPDNHPAGCSDVRVTYRVGG